MISSPNRHAITVTEDQVGRIARPPGEGRPVFLPVRGTGHDALDLGEGADRTLARAFYHPVMVSTPVLATKLFPPAPRRQLVARPRVAGRLDTTLDPGHRLTLVSAPAGFGKTTLLSDWLTDLDQRQPDTRVGWLSLDDGDNDLTRFMAHLVAALQSAELEVDAAVLELLSTAPTADALLALDKQANEAYIKSDSLIGSVVGKPDSLPDDVEEISIEVKLFDTAVGTQEMVKVEPIKPKEPLRLNVGTAATLGAVTNSKDDQIEVKLRKPLCLLPKSRVAVSRRISDRWRLIGAGITS